MTRRSIFVFVLMAASATVHAQGKPAPPAKPAVQARPSARTPVVRPRGFATFGAITFQASQSFDAILGAHTGATFGGGGQLLLPWNSYVEIAAWRFRASGERVFVGPRNEIFPLGIATEVAITPIEISGGWRYRHCPRAQRLGGCAPKLIPYAGAGFSSYKYSERSEFAQTGDDSDSRHHGYHLVGGAEYQVSRLIALGGEVMWSSVSGALGEGGVSAAFNEDNLGATAVRVKMSIGRR